MDNVQFHPLSLEESKVFNSKPVDPCHASYECGACGKDNVGRVVADSKRSCDGKRILWCVCSCAKEEPTVLVQENDRVVSQFPLARAFHPAPNWPRDLAKLYDEAGMAYAAGAFTAAAMVARKLLMACACKEGADEGLAFQDYVTYLLTNVVPIPRISDAIDAIRTIGNDANHVLAFVQRDDARRALTIVTFLLDTLYSFPAPSDAPAP